MTLRGTGQVLGVDPEAAIVVATVDACAQPRGVTVDERGDIWVACAGGELLTIGEGRVVTRTSTDVDVRDVMVVDGVPWTSRFRTARVGPVDDESRGIPNFKRPASTVRLHPSVAWRTRWLPDGTWMMLHQLASDATIAIDDEHDDDGATGAGFGSDGGGFGGSDGGGSYGEGAEPCGGLVQVAITAGDAHGDTWTSGPLLHTIGAVDFDVSPAGTIAIAVSGRDAMNGGRRHDVLLVDRDALGSNFDDACMDDAIPISFDAQAVAVAFDGDGMLWVQSREPNWLIRVDPADIDQRHVIGLTGPSRYDTGHDMFHRDTGAGIACASCHPEGGDDGHVWRFDPLGARHTPSLTAGLAGTEPFHWQGDLASFQALVDEVFTARMGAQPQSPERAAALARFVLAQDSGPARWDATSEAVARGREAFDSFGCATCHGDADRPAELGFGFALQSPPLGGVALHPPYMHDGRAKTLRDAVVDMLVRTSPEAAPSDATIDDLLRYLETR